MEYGSFDNFFLEVVQIVGDWINESSSGELVKLNIFGATSRSHFAGPSRN